MTSPIIARISDDTGRSSTDFVTTDRVVDIAGTAGANLTITVTVTDLATGTDQVFTTQSDAAGAWVIRQVALVEGNNNVLAISRDGAGNELQSPDRQILVDPNPPLQPAVTGLSTDTGLPQDNITADGTLIFSGTAHPDALVTVQLDGTNLGTVTPDALGGWSFDHSATDLPDGTYTVDLIATSVAGVTSTSAQSFTFTVDKTAPSAPVITGISDDDGASPSDGITTDQTLIFRGTAEPLSFIELKINGTSVAGAQTDAQGNWSVDYTGTTLAPGQYSVTADASDLAGNTSAASTPFPVEVVTPASVTPVVTRIINDTGFDATDSITNDTRLIIEGTAAANATVEVSLNGVVIGTTQSNAQGGWSFDHTGTALAEGGHVATAVAITGSTRSAQSQPFLITVDTTPPATPSAPDLMAVSDSGASDSDNITATQGLIISTTSEPGATVTLRSDLEGVLASGTVGADGTVEFRGLSFREGVHSVTATAEDAAGNQTGSSLATQITVDRTPPDPVTDLGLVSRTAKNATLVDKARLLAEGPANTEVVYFATDVNGTTISLGTDTFDATGFSFFIPTAVPPSGFYTFSAVTQDIAGNQSAPFAITGTIDSDPPAPATITNVTDDTGRLNTDKVTADDTPVFSGTGSAGEQVFLVLFFFDSFSIKSGLHFGPVTIAADGTWSIAIPAIQSLADRTYEVTTVTEDQAGNTTETVHFNLTIDTATVAPTITQITGANGQILDGDIVNDTSVTFTGTAEPGADVELVFLGSGSDPDINAGTVRALFDGSWSLTVSGADLPERVIAPAVFATDAAGNELGTTNTPSFTIDRTPPHLTLDGSDATGVRSQSILFTTTDALPYIKISYEAGLTPGFVLPNGVQAKLMRQVTSNGVTEELYELQNLAGQPFTQDFQGDIEVTVVDAAGNTTVRKLEIQVNLPPTDLILAGDTVFENSAAGTVIGTITPVDPSGPGDFKSITFDANVTDPFFDFEVSSSGVVTIKVAKDTSFDFEAAQSHSFDLTYKDGFESEITRTFTINVIDIPELFIGGDMPKLLLGDAGDNMIDAGAGDDTVSGGAGGDTVTLGTGADQFRDSAANLDGDVFTDFWLEDLLVLTDQMLSRARFSFNADGTVGVDTDGDGTPDVTFTLQGDYAGGDFMAVSLGNGTRITYETLLPALGDQQAVDAEVINGINNQAFLTGDGMTDFQVTLQDTGVAGYDNVIGVYEIDEAGNIVDTRLLFTNANLDQTDVARITDVEAGHQLGFFIVQDAAAWAASLAAGDTLSFVNGAGEAADLADGDDLFIAVNGVATTETVYHSFSEDMNTDGVQHALSGVEIGGDAITIGFEDLTGGGDQDYQDVVFLVETVDSLAFL